MGVSDFKVASQTARPLPVRIRLPSPRDPAKDHLGTQIQFAAVRAHPLAVGNRAPAMAGKYRELLSSPRFVFFPSLDLFEPCHLCALCCQRVPYGTRILRRGRNLCAIYADDFFCPYQRTKKHRALLAIASAGRGLGSLRARIVMRAGGEGEDDGGEEQLGDVFHFQNHRWFKCGRQSPFLRFC